MPQLLLDLDTRGPTSHVALSRALLEGVAAGVEEETLQIARIRPCVAFGPRDLRSEGALEAAAAARRAGFEPVTRLEGGRAVIAHEQVLQLTWTAPDPAGRARLHERFEMLTSLLVGVLRAGGIDARLGEVSGEYCPGRYSVNAGGRVKLAGFGQRLVEGAVHVGGMLVVAGAPRLRDVLGSVQRALGAPFAPATLGSIEEEGGDPELEAWAARLAGALRTRFEARPGGLSDTVRARAAELEPSVPLPQPAGVL